MRRSGCACSRAPLNANGWRHGSARVLLTRGCQSRMRKVIPRHCRMPFCGHSECVDFQSDSVPRRGCHGLAARLFHLDCSSLDKRRGNGDVCTCSRCMAGRVYLGLRRGGTAPLASFAQPAQKVRRIGYLSLGASTAYVRQLWQAPFFARDTRRAGICSSSGDLPRVTLGDCASLPMNLSDSKSS